MSILRRDRYGVERKELPLWRRYRIVRTLTDHLIAHYKMNENTASDNDELVTNGNFAAWTDDNPDGWTVSGETSPSSHTIDAVDTGAETFTISDEGDLSTWFKDGNIFEVTGSTGNDGQWTVSSTSWSSPNFVIAVTGNITNAVADGTITPHSDPNISEVGTGEAHGGAGTGMCNLYTSDGSSIRIRQTITLVTGRKYRVSINIDTSTNGELRVYNDGEAMFATKYYTTTGVKTFTFVAIATSITMALIRNLVAFTDITFDDFSVKLCAVEDSSGNDHDGLLQEDTDAAHVTGKINGAFDFNGSSDYLEIADHADFTPAGTPFSISVWVNMHTATYFVWASKWQAGSNQEWLLFTGTQKTIYYRIYDNSAGAYIGRAYGTSLASYEGQWTHFVATYDGGISSSGIRIYLNGLRVDDAPSENNPGSFVAVENLNSAVWIGRYDTHHADGLIDNMMFFDVELTLSEVRFLYNNSIGIENIP